MQQEPPYRHIKLLWINQPGNNGLKSPLVELYFQSNSPTDPSLRLQVSGPGKHVPNMLYIIFYLTYVNYYIRLLTKSSFTTSVDCKEKLIFPHN